MFFHEGNQACGFTYSIWLDIVAAPQRILAVEVSADYEMAGSIRVRRILRDRRIERLQSVLQFGFCCFSGASDWGNVDGKDQN